AEGWGDPRIVQRRGAVGALRAVGAPLVVAGREALRGAEPDEHRVEAGARGPPKHLRSVGAVAAEAIPLAELSEHLREPGIRDDERVFGLPRRPLRCRTLRVQQLSEHTGTDCAF